MSYIGETHEQTTKLIQSCRHQSYSRQVTVSHLDVPSRLQVASQSFRCPKSTSSRQSVIWLSQVDFKSPISHLAVPSRLQVASQSYLSPVSHMSLRDWLYYMNDGNGTFERGWGVAYSCNCTLPHPPPPHLSYMHLAGALVLSQMCFLNKRFLPSIFISGHFALEV